MLKSLQLKLVFMFVLIVLSIMLVVGTFLLTTITNFYHNEFKTALDVIFNTELSAQLDTASTAKDPAASMKAVLDAYSGKLGINSYRNFFILNGQTSEFIDGSNRKLGESIDKTSNITRALNGQRGNLVIKSEKYMDYAVSIPLNGPVKYVVYIMDTKEELNKLLNTMFVIILQGLLIGILISVIIGYLLSNTITAPIKNLTHKSEKLASGETIELEESTSKDEIGTLTNTFNYMAKHLNTTLQEIGVEKNKLETVVKYINDGIVAFDTDGKIILINPSAKKYLGIEDANDIEFNEFFKEKNVDVNLGDFIYLESDKRTEKTFQANGYDLKAYFGTFMFENNHIGGVVTMIQDITELEKLESSRREFVANVSHELRTPLTTIKSYIETLISSDVDQKTKSNFLNVIDKETDRMARLVKDLLTLSKLDNEKKNLLKDYLDVGELTREIVEKLSFEANTHKHQFSYNQASNLPLVYADRDRIEQTITNIISNAIKYTPDNGTIDVFVRHMYDQVYIRVKDNGIGIPEEDLERIFERFYRVDKARSREQGGTGLGLAIAKEIIESHGGTITIESTPSEGTEVVIKLPAVKENS